MHYAPSAPSRRHDPSRPRTAQPRRDAPRTRKTDHTLRRPKSSEHATRPGLVDVSLVIPAHNEELRLPETLDRYATALQGRYGHRAEIVVVANACSDDTVGAAERAARRHPMVSTIDIRETVGKGGAVLEGFRQARGASVVFADADGSTSPESLLDLVEGLRDHDIVMGSRHLPESRIERLQPRRRRALGSVFRVASRLLFGLRYADTQCGAKAFRRQAARRLAEVVREKSWTFDLDLILSARKLGMTVAERPVVWADVDGSRLSAARTARDVLTSFARLTVREWTDARRARTPHADSPLRILALNWRCTRHPETGGSELNLFEQARFWRQAGHHVTVVTARRAPGVDLPASERIDGIHVIRMGGRFSLYLQAAWYLVRNGWRYDRILDVSNGIPFFAPLFTATPTTLLVHHVHGRQWLSEFPAPIAAVGWMLERFVVPRVYRRSPVIAVSPTTRDGLLRTGFDPSQVRIVYNGVSVPGGEGLSVPAGEHGPGADTHPDGGTAGAPVIAYVGRIRRYKRLELLVRAFAALRREVPGARLEIAGDGEARPSVEVMARELGLGTSVSFHGRVDEAAKASLLGRATVFASPSMQEGWGLSVLEANSLGCPAVAYDVPGLRASIVDGETGLLARDDASFLAALTRIVTDASLRARMSTAARTWAARFRWDAAATETLDVLDVAAGARRWTAREAPAAA